MVTPDWSTLTTAYGPADDVPELLSAAEARPDDQAAWDGLWSSLCHQGTVYTASYAALPALTALAERAAPAAYVQPLYLAAMIVGSDDRYADAADVDVRLDHGSELARLRDLAERHLALAENARDLVYGVQCLAALEGLHPWAGQLDRVAEGRTDVTCPECGADIEVDLAHTTGATPADPQALDAGAARVHGLLLAQPEAADAFLRLAGTVPCPDCGATVRIPRSLA